MFLVIAVFLKKILEAVILFDEIREGVFESRLVEFLVPVVLPLRKFQPDGYKLEPVTVAGNLFGYSIQFQETLDYGPTHVYHHGHKVFIQFVNLYHGRSVLIEFPLVLTRGTFEVLILVLVR